MTPLQQLWIASALGAVAFFAAGALLATVRRRARVAVAVPGGATDARELEQLRQRAEKADAANAELRAAAKRAREELATLRAEQAKPARETMIGSAAPPAVPSARAATPPVPPDARMQERLATVERELAERTAQLRDASTELDLMKARVNDAEAVRTDYVRLRTQVNEMEFLAKEVERLKEELRSAKSLAIGGVKKIPRTVKPAPTAAGSITDALSGAIERFSDPKMRCIAIADKVGFPVSSYGDDGVELAGYAALLNDVASRATQFLPVAAPASIEMVDEHGARISVWPFDVADERLLLVNLGVGATDAHRVEHMLSEVVGILTPAALSTGTRA